MKNIVIIGAGPSGLTAALEILRNSREYSVTVIEADSVAGGISRTVEADGNRMDIGGHRFHTKSHRVFEFWNSIMPMQGAPAIDEIKIGKAPICLDENGADPEKTDRVMLYRRRVSRIFRKNKLYDYPVSFSTVMSMGAGSVAAFFSYLRAKILPCEENTLEDFYINRFGKRLYSTFFESYTEKVWGIHPSKLPPDWGSQRVKGLSVWGIIKDMLGNGKKEENSLIKSFLYPKFGPGQLWECAAQEIIERGGHVIFDANVEKIEVRNSQVVQVTAGGVNYPADIVVSSMPLAQMIEAIEGEKPCEEIIKTARELHFRDFITVGVEAKGLKLKNKTRHKTLGNIPPDCWIYVQEPDIKMGRLQIFNNWSPYMVREPESTVFLGTEYFCSEGDDMWSMSDGELSALAISELEKMGIISYGTAVQTKCIRMKKAYPSYDGSYKDIEALIKCADSIDGLFCVGRNGQHRYNNMDHSMLTAMAAADAILGRGDKKAVWAADPEKEDQ